MERRKFLVGMGSLAAGSAAAMGTGAFTSTTARRGMDVRVADDASAALALSDVPESENSANYVTNDGDDGQLTVDISGSNDAFGGNGVNAGAATFIDDLFRIKNLSGREQFAWILERQGRTSTKWFAFYVGSGPADGDDFPADKSASAKPDYAISLADYNNGLKNTRPRELQPQSRDGVDTQAAPLGAGEYVDVGLAIKVPSGVAENENPVPIDGTVTINSFAQEQDLPTVLQP